MEVLEKNKTSILIAAAVAVSAATLYWLFNKESDDEQLNIYKKIVYISYYQQ